MTAMANLISSASSSHPPLLLRRNSISTSRFLITRPSLPLTASLYSLPPPPPSLYATSTRTITSLLSSASSFSRSLPTCIKTAVSAAPHLLLVRVPHNFRTMVILSLIRAMLMWLDVHMVLLLLKVLLRWIPHISRGQQALVTLRDVCDDICHPFLTFFSKFIPPVFGNLDLSPLLVISAYLALNSLLVHAHNSFI